MNMTVDILIAVAQKGGVENVINMTAPYLKCNGWEVRVVQLVWEGVAWVTEDIPFYPLLEGREGHDLEEFVQSYADFLERNGKPQMVLATAWPYMCYVGKKAAMHVKKDIAVISWLHAPVERYHAAGYGSYDSLFLADGHLAISAYIYKNLKKYIENAVVFLVHNPVDFSEVKIKKIRKRKGVKKLFFIGRLAEEKRIEVIIQAMGSVNGLYELHIIGEGEQEYKDFLVHTAKENGVFSRIHWYGWKENPWGYAEDADALVLASEYEGFPLTAIEAQARGVPVISTPVSGLVELIKPGVNGFFFPFGDGDALSEVLNARSAGVLPPIMPENCRKAVDCFRMEIALLDMECKLKEFYNNLARLKQSGGSRQILYSGERISVIIPCYNAENYFTECMESLLKQTIPLDMLEMILVDDASTDGTLEILKKYEEQFSENILLISCDENEGPGAARNMGLNYASGEYVVFVDADDYIKEDMLQKMYEKIKLYDCDMAECGYHMFTDDGRGKTFENRECFYNLIQNDEKRKYIVERGSFNSCWGKIYKREFIEKYQIRFPEHIYMEDIYFHQLCMMCAESCYVLSQASYFYRYNYDSIMHNPLYSSYVMDGFYVQEMVYQELEKQGKIEGYEQELALIYYVKGFCGPVSCMNLDKNAEDRKNLQLIKSKMTEHFPDILKNSYILQDKSEYNARYMVLLQQDKF